jgi:hypothetical protein
MIEKMPIVIPKSERKVLNLLTTTELIANRKLSLKIRRNILRNSELLPGIKDKKKHHPAAKNLLIEVQRLT